MTSSHGCAPDPIPTGPFSKLVVFGDSYSDTGNLFAQTGIAPAAPYFAGRFCNGPLWVDGLAAHLGLEDIPSQLGGTNYARAAAASGFGLAPWDDFAISLNILEQVNSYGDQPNGTELFVIWGGSIDIMVEMNGRCSNSPTQVAENINQAINTLYDKGGRYFLVVNLPDLGLNPNYRVEGKASTASSLCAEANTLVTAKLDQLDQLEGIHIYRLDAASLLLEMVQHPPQEITNVSDPAWTGTFIGYLNPGEVVANSNAYLYWDPFHPAYLWHAMLADKANALLDSRGPTQIPVSPTIALELPRLPAALNFWLSYFTLLSQPTPLNGECRY